MDEEDRGSTLIWMYSTPGYSVSVAVSQHSQPRWVVVKRKEPSACAIRSLVNGWGNKADRCGFSSWQGALTSFRHLNDPLKSMGDLS